MLLERSIVLAPVEAGEARLFFGGHFEDRIAHAERLEDVLAEVPFEGKAAHRLDESPTLTLRALVQALARGKQYSEAERVVHGISRDFTRGEALRALVQAGLTTRRLTFFPSAMLLWLSEKVKFGQSTVLVVVDETRMPLAA